MKFDGRTVMVTGGAGFIGSHVVDRLLQVGAGRVIVVDNLFLGRVENLDDARKLGDVRFVEMDATDEAQMRALIERERVSVVFDMATIPLPASLERPRWSSDVIWDLGMTVAELARSGAFERLIRCSSSEAYGSARYVPMDEDHPMAVETPYAAAKASTDLLVQSYMQTFAIDAIIVRPFNTYGPRQNDKSFAGIVPIVARRVLRGEAPTVFGDGQQTRDYQYVEDTAKGMVALAQRDDIRGQTVNVASGAEVTIEELVRKICRAAGYTGEVQRAPARVADVRRHLAGVKRLDTLLGARETVSLDDGIRRTVEWYRAHPEG